MEEKRVASTMVYCSKCGMGNPAANKFCYGCGGSLFSKACSFCGHVSPNYAGFCGSCGRELESRE